MSEHVNIDPSEGAAPLGRGGAPVPRPTQRHVAAMAGVSQATVSMVLGREDTPSVPAATRERVLQAAMALGYVPNRMAQSLRLARSQTLAVVVPDITNPFYPGFVRGVQNVAAPAGYDVMINDTDGSEAGERRALAWLRQGRVDGVAGAFFHIRAPEFEPLIRMGMAVVRLEARLRPEGDLPLDTVCIDNTAAAFGMTQHLLARGHRKIAMIAGRFGPGDQRVLGYEAAMRAAGLATEVMRDKEFTVAAGRRCAQVLLAHPPRPTAIFAANDLMAIGAMTELQAAGAVVPDDVAVAGFDDIPAAGLVAPSLTTIRHPQQALGEAAAALLVERLAAGGLTLPVRTRCLDFQIIERASV